MCPHNVSRLIDTGDVASYSALNSVADIYITEFIDLINVAPDNTHSDWGSDVIPNEGNLTFNEVFVIYQLTTRGEYYNFYNTSYISKFSLQYSESDNGDYMLHPMVIKWLDKT